MSERSGLNEKRNLPFRLSFLNQKNMETARLNQIIKSILVGIIISGVIVSFTSCATKAKFLASSVVPAAQGTIKVKKDNNKNYAIDIEIAGLAEVKKLQTNKDAYVAWMETSQGRTENLGQLTSSSGFLSKQMKASLKTVSSYKPTKIFITAEERTNIQYPSREVILTTELF